MTNLAWKGTQERALGALIYTENIVLAGIVII